MNHNAPVIQTENLSKVYQSRKVSVRALDHLNLSVQQGEIFGVPPSGRTVALPGINIWRVRDGRIVERWGRLDELGLLRQLGLVNLP